MTTWNDVKNDPNFIKILDHGFVGILDSMGKDSDIASAARTSYAKGTKTVRDDEKLIRYLVKHDHSSPIEMGEVKFLIKVPMFVARQLVRHRTANINEVSARYSVLPNEIYIPDLEHIQPQAKDNKQGRSGNIDINTTIMVQNSIRNNANRTYDLYEHLIDEVENTDPNDEYDFGDDFGGIAREIARTVLPVGAYTEMVWKQDLRNLLHLIRLRTDPHAQYEIRVMAQAMYDLIEPIFPATVKAYDDYVRNAHKLSAMEVEIMTELMDTFEVKDKWCDMINKEGLDNFLEKRNMSKREFNDFCNKWGLWNGK